MTDSQQGMTKTDVRAAIREKLHAMSPQQRDDHDRRILERLMALPDFQTAERVFSYLPLPHEVNTRPIVDMLLDIHGVAYVPVTDRGDHTLRVAELTATDELVEGAYGILEPAEPSYVAPDAIDVWILPGLAFDEQGDRLGQGGGFFDAFFAAHPVGGLKVALAYSFQVVDRVPTSAHDVPVDLILTENDVLVCGDPTA